MRMRVARCVAETNQTIAQAFFYCWWWWKKDTHARATIRGSGKLCATWCELCERAKDVKNASPDCVLRNIFFEPMQANGRITSHHIVFTHWWWHVHNTCVCVCVQACVPEKGLLHRHLSLSMRRRWWCGRSAVRMAQSKNLHALLHAFEYRSVRVPTQFSCVRMWRVAMTMLCLHELPTWSCHSLFDCRTDTLLNCIGESAEHASLTHFICISLKVIMIILRRWIDGRCVVGFVSTEGLIDSFHYAHNGVLVCLHFAIVQTEGWVFVCVCVFVYVGFAVSEFSTVRMWSHIWLGWVFFFYSSSFLIWISDESWWWCLPFEYVHILVDCLTISFGWCKKKNHKQTRTSWTFDFQFRQRDVSQHRAHPHVPR